MTLVHSCNKNSLNVFVRHLSFVMRAMVDRIVNRNRVTQLAATLAASGNYETVSEIVIKLKRDGYDLRDLSAATFDWLEELCASKAAE